MTKKEVHKFIGFLTLAFLMGTPIFARQSNPSSQDADQQPAQKKPDPNQQKKSDRKLMKELDTPYKKWLQEDVVYIITDEERMAFVQFSTNEEREQFIEQFWLRRDPTPDTVENEFKEEHYRRIAYANERFSSGFPGWRTDRGRIYIIHGPADEVESHPIGGAYERSPEEGGGSTSTYAFERWRYRYIEGIGNDVNLEFVDPSGSGEYHLTMDPSEKDALLHVPDAGLTTLESMGAASKIDRFKRTDGTHMGKSDFTNASLNEFNRIALFANINKPPAVKFKDLEEVVTFRLLRNQINFDYRFDFMRVTSDTVLVPITVQISNRQLTFKSKDGVDSAVLEIFGRVSTLTGRVVQTFEDTLNRDFPESLLAKSLEGQSVYQKAVPLRPGLYRLDLVLKDVNSGNIGVVDTRLAVPRFDYDKLSASTLIMADQMERITSKQIGLGQFVIGDAKVRPRVNLTFTAAERASLYLQIYNLGVDEKTHHSDVTFEFVLARVDGGAVKEVFRKKETSDEFDQSGQQVTLEKRFPLSSLAPGRYKFTVQVTDNVSKQSISPTAEFTVKEAAVAKN